MNDGAAPESPGAQQSDNPGPQGCEARPRETGGKPVAPSCSSGARVDLPDRDRAWARGQEVGHGRERPSQESGTLCERPRRLVLSFPQQDEQSYGSLAVGQVQGSAEARLLTKCRHELAPNEPLQYLQPLRLEL